MKSELQARAEEAVHRFKSDARRPIVIEFAGVPKAGKTSTISAIQGFFKRCGFQVQIVVERASVCPIRDKKHFTFNVWTAATTLAQILQNTQEPPRGEEPQILILDRGLFDSICWLTTMDRLSRIRTEDRLAIEAFLLLEEWRKRITGVIVMTVDPKDAMERESGLLPVAAEGSIMNIDVLQKTLDTTRECIKRVGPLFQIAQFDTSGHGKDGPRKTAETVCEQILNWIEQDLDEEIFFVPKHRIAELFNGRTTLISTEANSILELFAREGAFRPRKQVEEDTAAVQALPVVVVRNKSGDVLVMRRRERQEANKLHERLVIWAGGHVRREDGTNGTAIVRGALRELKEELRLNVESTELRFLGAVYADSGGKTSRHVAIVFEWRAETDDVAITLSSAEFFERRGTSLSGKFVPLGKLATEISAEKNSEVWSDEIVRQLLPNANGLNQGALF
ncbi:MAG TPA: NUDIX domain-containing protein [Tepidisphaeraceae bacterium]|nr:NUDIX domain-containing protein [Tepidisphaeraceae bacterium]